MVSNTWFDTMNDIKCLFKWTDCLYCRKLQICTLEAALFPHRSKSFCFFLILYLSPLQGDQRRFLELWVYPLHGREQFEVPLFHPADILFIFSVNMDCSWTQSLETSVVFVEFYLLTVPWEKKKKIPRKGVKLGCPTNCLDDHLCYFFTCTWNWPLHLTILTWRWIPPFNEQYPFLSSFQRSGGGIFFWYFER